MGFIQMIIDFLKSLFGGGESSPALPSSSGGAAPARASSSTDDDDDDREETEEETEARIAAQRAQRGEKAWKNAQALIQMVETGGLDIAGVNAADPKDWWRRHMLNEQALRDGQDAQAAARAAGFKDLVHMAKVREYVFAKWSVLGTGDDGHPDVKVRDEFMDAMMQVQSEQFRQQQQAAAVSDPKLLEPVAGVTLEQYAKASAACAKLGTGATPQQVAETLAKFGLDRASFDTASAGWTAKMQADTSFVITTKFGEYFSAAQGVSADGPEPCTFEQYVEVLTAQTCWAEQGIDIASQMKKTFGIDLATYGAWGQYWSPKMQTQAYYRKFNELEPQFKAKYAGAKMDDDLSL